MKEETKDKVREYKRQYSRNKYHERRAYAIERLGGKCANPECGSIYNLDIDHINPDEKEYNPFGSWWSVPQEIFDEELKKCQLLCRSCHRKKTFENKDYGAESQHGTTYRYLEYKCRCEECVHAMRECWAKYKKKSRTQERLKDYIQERINPYLFVYSKEDWSDIIKKSIIQYLANRET